VSETKRKEQPSQTPKIQAQASSQSQYIPDKTLRRVCLEKADKPEKSNK
jgi:hypothetical protein